MFFVFGGLGNEAGPVDDEFGMIGLCLKRVGVEMSENLYILSMDHI